MLEAAAAQMMDDVETLVTDNASVPEGVVTEKTLAAGMVVVPTARIPLTVPVGAARTPVLET